ncbi:Starch-binding associating with outer membrane [Chitinophaga costaii]|uniref:Starch-binding associating with outer membrane n=1 Tax=Chitinophaga costaii TaxID=1335309 RepID=A0A1C3Z246_9BACT|nr:RagB/SusD family nutrient uptake outer membrane protein [Chitinophaga costaii]PUZ30201.1 RagB/SusD family nutrient uptake outer membrane protein [Chitinophaga costaii]SCB76474.1 Starch-binding associating with outer membrane [Chitinophaga costaii]
MKYIIYISVFTLLFTSCNKVMDTKPLDSYTADAVWSNFSLAQGYIYNCYANDIGFLYSWEQDAITKSVKTHPWGGSFVDEKTEQMDRYTDEGWNKFSNIRAVNLALQNVPNSSFTTLQKNTLLGEAHFLRAGIYAFLAFRFGGVQIVKNVLTADSNFSIPRSGIKDTYDFILADLDTAATLLPTTNDRGRATQGAAYALKMRVALQAGAYLNNDDYYKMVKAAGEALFALNLYAMDDYSNLFNAYSTAIASPENILVYERRGTNTTFDATPMQILAANTDMSTAKLTTTAMQLFPLKESSEGWMNYAPTQDLVDDYLVTDADGKERKWTQTSYLNTATTVYDKMYNHRDKRFYATIIYDSSKLFNNWAYLRASGNFSSNIQPLNGGNINDGASQTGYLFNKYIYQAKKIWYSDPTDFCYSVLRLGEAYLNYAEACIKLGNEALAAQYITKTYQQHGGFKNEITATGEELWSAYQRERHIDMILETGDRYWSLLRWGMQQSGGLKQGYANSGAAISALNGKPHGIAISLDGKSYQIFETVDNNGQPLKFSPRRYLFPVPQDRITALPLLTQNEGW